MKKTLGLAFLGLCVPVTVMPAEPLGRLFFTPAQRSTLDAGKYTVAKTPTKPGPRTVRLSGVVTRSDSERTVWINGTPYYNAAPEGVQIKTNPATPGSTSIRMQGKVEGARVKVGQQIDLNSGKVREVIAAPADEAKEPDATTQVRANRPVTLKPRVGDEASHALPDKDADSSTSAR